MEAIYMDQITPLFIFSKTFEEISCHFFKTGLNLTSEETKLLQEHENKTLNVLRWVLKG